MTENTTTTPDIGTEQPKTRVRDRKVGILTLTASTVAALVVGGVVGAATGGLVGYVVGHEDRPDRPGIAQVDRPDRPYPHPLLRPRLGELPPEMAPEDESSS